MDRLQHDSYNYSTLKSVARVVVQPLERDCGVSLAPIVGEVSELVDEHDLGSCAERRGSSSLPFPTSDRDAGSSKAGVIESPLVSNKRHSRADGY